MNIRHLKVTGITGVTGTGRMKLGLGLYMLFPDNKHMAVTSVSAILTYHLHNGDEIGKAVRRHNHEFQAGLNLPDDIVIPAVKSWLYDMYAIRTNGSVWNFIIAGFPATQAQTLALIEFNEYGVAAIEAQDPTASRLVDEPKHHNRLRMSYESYRSTTRPAIKCLDRLVTIPSPLPLWDRVNLAISAIPGEHCQTVMRNRLRDNRSIRQQISELSETATANSN